MVMRPGAKFLRSLFEVAHVEFQTYDLSSHKLVFSSGVVCQLLGYSKAEYVSLSGDFYQTIVHPEDRDKVQQTIDKLIRSKNNEVAEMTVRLLKKDGNYVWLYSRQMIYERRPDCNACSMIREVEDVTRLMELQDTLEERVKQLESVSYKNSHLLRSPVASIIGLVNIIEDHGVTGEHNRQILDYLKQTIEKLDAVIHEINDNARM